MARIKASDVNTQELIDSAKSLVAQKYPRYIIWKKHFVDAGCLSHGQYATETRKKFSMADDVLCKCNSEIGALERAKTAQQTERAGKRRTEKLVAALESGKSAAQNERAAKRATESEPRAVDYPSQEVHDKASIAFLLL